MKVAIGRNGLLYVQSETQLESYALQNWSDKEEKIPKSMVVCWNDEHLMDIFKEEKKNG
jgi:hypothetical protein